MLRTQSVGQHSRFRFEMTDNDEVDSRSHSSSQTPSASQSNTSPVAPIAQVNGGKSTFSIGGRKTPLIAAVMILATVITALGLRPGATSIGPVLDEMSAALGLTPTVAGFLTALPGLCFAVVGLTANRFTSLTGLVGALVVASALGSIGLLLRATTGSWQWFLILSALALGGAAIGNVVLPAYIKAEFPKRAAPMATVYTTALAIGSTVPIFVATPIARAVGEQGWRVALGVWGFVVLAALVIWVCLFIAVPRFRSRRSAPARPYHWWQQFRSPTAVGLMFFFGLQSMQAYIQFGWIPTAYRAGGLDADIAAWMAAIIAVGGIPGGLIMPSIVARKRLLRPAIVLFGILLATGYIGIAFAPTAAPWLWAVCLSISGFCFPTALALIIERTKNPGVTASVSGFVQPVGYLLAATGPFLVGAAFGSIGDWKPILLVLAATSVLLVAAGWLATRSRYIDDELSGGTAASTSAPRR